MNILEIVRFALRGLTTNKLRTTLTTLGIAIGVASVIILIAVGNGSSKQIQASIDKLGTNTITINSTRGGFGRRAAAAGTSSKPLTVSDAVALSSPVNAPDIKQAAPITSASGTCTVGTSSTTPGTFYGTWPSWSFRFRFRSAKMWCRRPIASSPCSRRGSTTPMPCRVS